MSRTLRLASAMALALGAVPLLGVGPANADSLALNGVTAGYFSSTGVRKPDAFPATIPEAAQPNNQGADGAAAGNLPVAARAGAVDKLSFVLFDLLSVERGSVITKATLSMPLVENSKDNTTYAADPAKVLACPAGDEGFFGEDGAAIEDAPSFKCDVASTPGKASADGKAYEFDITKIAAGWIDINDGIALAPAADARSTPFQVVFGPVTAASLSLEFTPPPVAPEQPAVTPGDSGPVDFGGSFGGTVAPPPSFGSGTTFDPGPVPAPAPQAGVAPLPAAPLTASPLAASPVALETLRPDTSFWLGGLVLAGLLGLLSLIMGDQRVPQRSGSKSLLTQALADRQRGQAARSVGFGSALPI